MGIVSKDTLNMEQGQIKRLEKLQKIIDWEADKPKTDKEWAEDVKAESLHVKFDYQLEEMLSSHIEKTQRVEKDLEVFTDFPQVKIYELTQQFKSMFEQAGNPVSIENKTMQEWIDEEFASQETYYNWKYAKLNQSVERIAKEKELREKGAVVTNKNDDKSFKDIKDVPEDKRRYLLGTTYYIDPTNGTDTFAGTRIDSTVDVSATTTTFTDDALTGADDYLNGSYFFNVTRGLGSLITDFDGTLDLVTLADAITGMAAGDTYYILNSWLDLDQFTENARSAGDKVIIRRGAVQCDDGTDLTFTSDGTIANPIIIEADYDNLWRDQVDLSATGTATLTFGSKTITFSSDVSGVLAAGDWIYASGDNNREFAYEVASVSSGDVTLYLPYKGNQAGSGKTMYNMQDNPIWNSAAGDFQWNFDGDDYWKVQGIHIRGTDVNGNVEVDSCRGHQFDDCIFQGNGSTDAGFSPLDDNFYEFFNKCRFFGHVNNFGLTGDTFGHLSLKNCLLDGNNVASSAGFTNIGNQVVFNVILLECEFKNHAGHDMGILGAGGTVRSRNTLLSSTNEFTNNSGFGTIDGLEDHDGAIGDSRYYFLGIGSSSNAVLYQSETTTVRSGGSNKSIKVTPTTNMTTIWDFNKLMVFEIPIYATTDSKTYEIYFRPSATGDWTNDPTASELWIELEAWGHATNNFRKITKSTGTIDMNGSTSWQALSVTVAPAQAGVAYLRCYYAKTKEAGSNIFYVDPVPVIS